MWTNSILILLLVLIPSLASAKEDGGAVSSIAGTADLPPSLLSDSPSEDLSEHIEDLTLHPLNINKVDVEELKQVPGLDMDQISDILEYRHRYGNMRSIEELALIPSIDNNLRRFLSTVLTVAPDSAARRVTHTLLATATIPTYYRAGDSGSGSEKYAGLYLGDPLAHSIRYTLTYGNNLTFNLSGGKKAAEPFFSNGNRWGYDRYAFNVMAKNVGVFRRIIAGQYRAQFGMGLVLNNNFSLGKQSALNSASRLSNVFVPHSSTYDGNHLQGVAATADLGAVSLSAFLSYRYLDATLNTDGTIHTILSSSYHRTAGDMEKKNDAAQFSTGAHLSWCVKTPPDIHATIGASVLYTHLNRPIVPAAGSAADAGDVSTSQLYRLYYPTGSSFYNASLDYQLQYRRLALSGETAMADNGALATLNSVSCDVFRTLKLTAIQRYYSYQYRSLYASSFSEGGRVQNESGFCLAAQYMPRRSLVFDAYADYAYFPWYRYRVAPSSHTWDAALTATYSPSAWTFALRYRIKTREQMPVAADAEALTSPMTTHRLRLTAILARQRWTARSHAEMCHYSDENTSTGFVLSQALAYTFPSSRIAIGAHAAYFHTTDFDSRMYIYERGMQYSYGYHTFYGNGYRAALHAKLPLSRHVTLAAKASHTHYFDRSVIASADRAISSHHLTDFDLQLKLRL